MMIIKNWSITSNQNGSKAPESLKYYLNGNVYGSDKFKDGTYVRTSAIQDVIKVDGCKQICTMNSTYHIFKDEVDSNYEKEFTDVYEKLNMIYVE